MKNWLVKLLAAIGAATGLTIWLSQGPLAYYFMPGIPSGLAKEAEILIILWLLAFCSVGWLLHMAAVLPLRRDALLEVSMLMLRYAAAVGIFAGGINQIQRQYAGIDICTTLEQSMYLLKYAGLLVLCLVVVTDFKKWRSVRELHRQVFRQIGPTLRKPFVWIGRGLAAAYRGLARGLRQSKSIWFMLLTAIWSFLIVEIFCSHPFYELSAEKILWNLLLYFILALLIWAPVRNVKWASVGMLAVCALLGGVNYFVILFRGNPVSVGDFAQVKTALSVAGSYHYTFNVWFFRAVLLTAAGILWCLCMKLPARKISVPNRLLSIGIVYILIGGVLLTLRRAACYRPRLILRHGIPVINRKRTGIC